MQCPFCNAVYSNGLDNCPRCKASVTKPLSLELDGIEDTFDNIFLASIDDSSVTAKEALSMSKETYTQPVVKPSTLIEFPKNKQRQNLPEWRKELLEKFKEIQERREREGKALSSEETNIEEIEPLEIETKKPQLEVVPSAPPAPVNPIVAAALARIEKAHTRAVASRPQTRHAAAALAVATLPDEQEEPELKVQEQRLTLVQPQTTQTVSSHSAPKVMHAGAAGGAQRQDYATQNQTQSIPTNKTSVQANVQAQTASTARALAIESLVQDEPSIRQTSNGKAVVAKPIQDGAKPPQLNKASATTRATATIATDLASEIKEVNAKIQRIKAESRVPRSSNEVYIIAQYDDYAPFIARIVCAFFDLLVIAFATSPFAAILELSGVDWSNNLVLMALGAILLIVSFVYLMAPVAMIGRTWGMAILRLRVANDENGRSPTTGQSSARALLFLLSMAAFGLPFLYAFFDAEGRALHDRMAGTIVVKEE